MQPNAFLALTDVRQKGERRWIDIEWEIKEGLIWGSAVVMAMQRCDELTAVHQTSIRGIQRCFGWWYGCRGMREWAPELEAQARWWITYMLQQPRHAELTLRIDEPHLLSPLFLLPVISIITPSPCSILHLLISSLFVSLFFFHLIPACICICLSLAGLTLHLALDFSPSLCLLTLSTLCVSKSGKRAVEVPYQ